MPNRWVYKGVMRFLGMVLKGNYRVIRGKDSNKKEPEARWEIAEREVGRLLIPLLMEGCIVLNDVPFPYGNLDHLVFSPNNTIYLIETKSYRGKITWDGKQLFINKRPFPTNPFCQINRSIRWVKRIAEKLSGQKQWIVAVLVFPFAKVEISRSVKRVNVIESRDLVSFIQKYPGSRRKRKTRSSQIDPDDFPGCCYSCP